MICPDRGGSSPNVENISRTFLDMAVSLQLPVLPMANTVLSERSNSSTVIPLTESFFALVDNVFRSCSLRTFWMWILIINAMNLMKKRPLAR